MKIIVYEHVSGGGYCGQPIPPCFLAEGFAMLCRITADFKAAGHTITVFLDARLSILDPPIEADFIVPVFYPDEILRFLGSISMINDAVYIIAPEKGNIIQTIVAMIEKTEKVTLNCTSKAIGKVIDKPVLYEDLEENGFSIPKTLVLENGMSIQQIKQSITQKLNYPLIFKPADGVGATGLSIVKEDRQIGEALTKINIESGSKNFIIQEFIKGEPVSVSLISTGKKALAVSLNKQCLIIEGPDGDSKYVGGIVPFDHPLRDDAFRVAEKVVESFPGLHGYVGVDLILTNDTVFIVDVNPRLTTSFVGLDKVANFNIAEALINSVLFEKLPSKIQINGFACFQKQEISRPTIEKYRKSSIFPGIISPPFPLEGNSQSCAFIIGYSNKLDKAHLLLQETQKKLQTNIH
jgi:predicted ATP-grasp superfamily ATP-dependent carboligase